MECSDGHEGFSVDFYKEYFRSEDWGNANGGSLSLPLKSMHRDTDVAPSPSSGYGFYVDITPEVATQHIQPTQSKQGSENKIKESTHQWFSN
jgi:hypothetical protein